MGIGRKRSEQYGSPKVAAELIRQASTLFGPFNKQRKAENPQQEGAIEQSQEPLSLEMTDAEILTLKNQWEGEYNMYYAPIETRQKTNVKYWLGKQFGFDSESFKAVDNVIFESDETLLPIIARQQPVPFVLADNTDEGIELSNNVARMLSYIADQEKLKLKIKQAARNWSLFLLSCLKTSWDYQANKISIEVVRPDMLMLDPTGTFDGGEFTGRFICQYKDDTAENLMVRFPKQKEAIRLLCGDKLGTTMRYQEWWTNEYVCWTMGGIVLAKHKNPHWNYSTEEDFMDRYGVTGKREVKGNNHFYAPKMPFSFMWCFTLGKQPHDETSLIEQAIPLQDIVNKRTRQVDRNADDTNNGWVFNNQFDENKANLALNALRNGGAIVAPTTDINQSVQRMQAPPLAQYVINEITDKREQIYNIMGTRGSSAQGLMSERTVRGKVEIKGQDVDRVSLITENIEQMVDYLFNYCTQLMYVYYDEPHVAAFLGQAKAVEYVTIQKSDLNRQLIVSVKEGSMTPQDQLSKRNEAIDLFNSHAIGLVTLLERLDFPNPKEAAQEAIQYNLMPQSFLEQPPPAPPGAIPLEPGQMVPPAAPSNVAQVPPISP